MERISLYAELRRAALLPHFALLSSAKNTVAAEWFFITSSAKHMNNRNFVTVGESIDSIDDLLNLQCIPNEWAQSMNRISHHEKRLLEPLASTGRIIIADISVCTLPLLWQNIYHIKMSFIYYTIALTPVCIPFLRTLNEEKQLLSSLAGWNCSIFFARSHPPFVYLSGVQILVLWAQSRQFDQIFNECFVLRLFLFLCVRLFYVLFFAFERPVKWRNCF